MLVYGYKFRPAYPVADNAPKVAQEPARMPQPAMSVETTPVTPVAVAV
jgi:hypothetical protein